MNGFNKWNNYEEQLVLFESLIEYSSVTSLQMSPNFQFGQAEPS